VFDYHDETKDVRGKVIVLTFQTDRLNALQDLQQMMNEQKFVTSLIIPNLDDVMQMIERNIFRPLPNIQKKNLGFSETGIEQEDEVDPVWPHIQGVYELFLQLVVNEAIDVKSLKVYITPQFVQEFLELFDSEESFERDYLKNILHKLYAKVSQLLFTSFSWYPEERWSERLLMKVFMNLFTNLTNSMELLSYLIS